MHMPLQRGLGKTWDPVSVTASQVICTLLDQATPGARFFFSFLVLPLYCYQPISLHPRAHMLSHVTPWTAAHQASLSMDFSRQEYWSGLPFPSPWSKILKYLDAASITDIKHLFFFIKENKAASSTLYYIHMRAHTHTHTHTHILTHTLL